MVHYDDNNTRTVRDDRVVHDHHDNGWSDTLARALAGLALVLSLVALTLGWMAYNRTGEDLEDRIQRGVTDAVNATADTAKDAVNNTERAIDAGPDGVDEDDTDVAR